MKALLTSAFALAVLALALAAPAAARPPVLLSVGQSEGRILADWELPDGVESDVIEASRNPEVRNDGSFKNTAAYFPLDSSQTHWRSRMLPPGTYYVHVSGYDYDCLECPLTEWSEIKQVDVLEVPQETGTYKGKIGYFGAKIEFFLRESGKKLKNLTVQYELDCPYGVLKYKLRFKSTKVTNGRFKEEHHAKGEGGSEDLKITGEFKPPNRAVGRFKAKANLEGIGKCKLFGAPKKGFVWRAKPR